MSFFCTDLHVAPAESDPGPVAVAMMKSMLTACNKGRRTRLVNPGTSSVFATADAIRHRPNGYYGIHGGGAVDGRKVDTTAAGAAWCTGPDRRVHIRVSVGRVKANGMIPPVVFDKWSVPDNYSITRNRAFGLWVYPELVHLYHLAPYRWDAGMNEIPQNRTARWLEPGEAGLVNQIRNQGHKSCNARTEPWPWLLYADWLEDHGLDPDVVEKIRAAFTSVNEYVPSTVELMEASA